MSFKEISQSGVLYACVAVGLLTVVAISVLYLRKSYNHAIACGVSKEKMKGIIKSSISFSIVPSIAIIAGLISLAAVIGLPYSWFRLSVLGSVTYELMASNMALSSLGLNLSNATGYAFGLVMWAMCLGITIGNVFNIFMCKKVHLGLKKLGGSDKKWGVLSQSVFMNALFLIMIVPMIASGGASLLTLITSACLGLLIGVIVQKTNMKWLGNFTLAISLIGAMAASVFFDSLF
ncbi:DUF5058 family protein [Emergencia timonensis]|uniref:DUF5058 family protein n=1 Tax=Emergencia timonensis TaxID=1776384 RepID=UPI003991CB96